MSDVVSSYGATVAVSVVELEVPAACGGDVTPQPANDQAIKLV